MPSSRKFDGKAAHRDRMFMSAAGAGSPMDKSPKCPYCGKSAWDGPFQLGMAASRGKDDKPTSDITEGESGICLLKSWACTSCGHVRLNKEA